MASTAVRPSSTTIIPTSTPSTQDILTRAKGYPYERPGTSFLFLNGVAYPLEDTCPDPLLSSSTITSPSTTTTPTTSTTTPASSSTTTAPTTSTSTPMTSSTTTAPTTSTPTPASSSTITTPKTSTTTPMSSSSTTSSTTPDVAPAGPSVPTTEPPPAAVAHIRLHQALLLPCTHDLPPSRPVTAQHLLRAEFRDKYDDSLLDLSSRVPVLAYGSNAAPVQLRRKFCQVAASQSTSSSPVFIPVLKATLLDFDTVYAPSITSYGSVPATLQYCPGAAMETYVTPLRTRMFITCGRCTDAPFAEIGLSPEQRPFIGCALPNPQGGPRVPAPSLVEETELVQALVCQLHP